MADEETLAIGVNSRGAVVGAKKYEGAMNQIQNSTTKTGGVLKGFGNKLTGLFAGISAGLVLKKTIGVVADFEITMAELAGVTKATASEMETFKKTARELGASTRFSASQASEGLLALSRAGFTVAEANEAIADTLTLATASQLDLGRASEITSNTIRQFGLEAKDAGKVADILVNTANKANTDVDGLAESMKFAGVMAGQFGISLEETSAVIGALANVGLKGGIAGRNLAQVLSSLASPSKEGAKALAELGLTMEQVNPERVGIIRAMEALGKANATTTQLTKLFSGAQLKVVLPLIKSTKAMDEFVKSNKEANGTAKENADLIENTLSGAFLTLKSAIEEAMLSAGDKGLLGTLKEIVKFSTDVVRSLTGVETGASKTFLEIQIRINKTIQGVREFFAMFPVGFKVIATSAGWVVDRIGWLFKGMVNSVIDSFQFMVTSIIDGLANTIEALEGPASFVSTGLKEEMASARIALYNRRNSIKEQAKGLLIENDVVSLKDRIKKITSETDAEVRKIQQSHIAVHGELQKELNVMILQEAQTKKKKREADELLKVNKEIAKQAEDAYQEEMARLEYAKYQKHQDKPTANFYDTMGGANAGQSLSDAGVGKTTAELDVIAEQRKNILDIVRQTWKIDELTAVATNKIAQGVSLVGNKTKEYMTKVTDWIKGAVEESAKFKITWEDIGGAISGTLTDALLKTKDWESALLDVTDTLIRMAVQQAIMSGFSGTPKAGKGLVAMASGGVVSGPTPALIGEAGPEAVIPLKRGENGELGLKSAGTQQVNNNFNLVSPDSRGIKDMLLRDPKLIRQMNETYKQGYAID